jgi:15-cis-phytoene synthase
MAETCADIVREQNRPRYIATLFAPDDLREHLFALYAFDAEIRRIPFLVNEPQIGEIRLQWWLDTIEAIYANATVDHPIALALSAAIRQGHLPQQPLRNLIEAHSRDLYADPMPSLNDLEGYLGETTSAVIQMAAQILMNGKAQNISDAAGLMGVAQGIADLLAQQPQLPHRGKHLLPEDTPTLIRHAEKRLAETKPFLPAIPDETRAAFLPTATTAARLNKLKSKGPGHDISPLRSQWLIWRKSRA